VVKYQWTLNCKIHTSTSNKSSFTVGGSESEKLQVEVKVKEEGVQRYIYKHYCQLIQSANYLCHFIIV